jgi:hypothetical protein
MRLDVFTFRPDGGPDFELWAPREMRETDAPEAIGALVADTAERFAPNLVLGRNRVSAEMTLDALAARLDTDATRLPQSEPAAQRTVAGAAGEVRIIAFTHAGLQRSGRLYQMTACLLTPADPDADAPDSGPTAEGERTLIYLTGTCTVEQMPTWDPAFVDAASSVRFG